MCGRNDWKQTHACGHTTPLEPCDEFAHALHECLADPGEKRVFYWDYMRKAPDSPEDCKFCKEGKDITKKWAYGKNWYNADRYRKTK